MTQGQVHPRYLSSSILVALYLRSMIENTITNSTRRICLSSVGNVIIREDMSLRAFGTNQTRNFKWYWLRSHQI
jgi:hypothetical protein